MSNTPPHHSRIREKFRELGRRKEGGLIAFLTGGDPNPKSFLENSASLVEGGADMLEVGIPFSDPIADGPVIQTSSMRAISNGATPSKILDAIAELSSQFRVPIVILSYYNPILAIGTQHFLKRAKDCGASGIVVPDLPNEEAAEFSGQAAKNGIDHIRLVAPNTSNARLRNILSTTNGFAYLVSLYGVTGTRDNLSSRALEAVKIVKSIARNRVPLAVGFGISRPEHVSSLIDAGADGAIVGSALVRIVSEHAKTNTSAEKDLNSTIKSLKRATTRR